MKQRTKRHLKLIAVVTVVLLTLTGFSHTRSSGGGGKSRGGSSSGGGGCGRDGSSGSSYNSGYSRNSGSSSSGGSGSSSRDREPDARIVSCRAADGRSVVQLTSRGRTDTFVLYVHFLDENGATIDSGRAQVRLKAGETRRVEVRTDGPDAPSGATECELGSVF